MSAKGRYVIIKLDHDRFKSIAAKLRKKSFIFRGLSDDDIITLLKNAKRNEFKKGQLIVEKGSPGNSFFVILSGEVMVDISPTSSVLLTEGDVFGEMSILDRMYRSANVRAASDNVCVLEITPVMIDKYLKPESAKNFYKNLAIQLSLKLRSTNEMIEKYYDWASEIPDLDNK